MDESSRDNNYRSGWRRVPPRGVSGLAPGRVLCGCYVCMECSCSIQPSRIMPDEENGTPLSQETAVDNGRHGERDSDVRHEQQQQQPDDTQETQEKPPTAKDSNPPPAPPPKKKVFTSLNVNQKFLSKTTTPAPTPGPQKQQNGKPAHAS